MFKVAQLRKIGTVSHQKRKRNNVSLTKEECLSNFRKSFVFGNVKLCVKCLKNITNLMSVEVKDDSDTYQAEELHLPEKDSLRRLGKFWICTSCINVNRSPVFKPSSLKLLMDQRINETVFVPVPLSQGIMTGPDDDNRCNDNPAELATFVLMPCSVKALDAYPQVEIEGFSSEQVLTAVYKGEVDHNDIEIYYQAQLAKYFNALKSSNIVYGHIEDADRKHLSSITPDTGESKIHGSNKWYESQQGEVMWRLKQNGNYSLHVTVDMPFQTDEVIATILIQSGLTVTTSLQSNSEGEYFKEYLVHTGTV